MNTQRESLLAWIAKDVLTLVVLAGFVGAVCIWAL